MKVEKRKSSRKVMIQDLKGGDIFLYDDCYYMVTDVDTPFDYVTTVDIEDGAAETFCKEKEVLPINGTFMID